MTKSEYIEYWKITAEKDWVAVGHLFEKGNPFVDEIRRTGIAIA